MFLSDRFLGRFLNACIGGLTIHATDVCKTQHCGWNPRTDGCLRGFGGLSLETFIRIRDSSPNSPRVHLLTSLIMCFLGFYGIPGCWINPQQPQETASRTPFSTCRTTLWWTSALWSQNEAEIEANETRALFKKNEKDICLRCIYKVVRCPTWWTIDIYWLDVCQVWQDRFQKAARAWTATCLHSGKFAVNEEMNTKLELRMRHETMLFRFELCCLIALPFRANTDALRKMQKTYLQGWLDALMSARLVLCLHVFLKLMFRAKHRKALGLKGFKAVNGRRGPKGRSLKRLMVGILADYRDSSPDSRSGHKLSSCWSWKIRLKWFVGRYWWKRWDENLVNPSQMKDLRI